MSISLPDFINNLKNIHCNQYEDLENVSFETPINISDLKNLPKNLKKLSFYYYSKRSKQFQSALNGAEPRYFQLTRNPNLEYLLNLPIESYILYKFNAEMVPNNITELNFYNCEIREITSLPPKLKKLLVERNYLLQYLPEIPETVEELYLSKTNINNLNNIPPNLKYISFTRWHSNILDLSIFPNSLETLYLVDNIDIKEIVVSGRKPKTLFDKQLIYCYNAIQLEKVCPEIEDFISDERNPEETLKFICEENKLKNIKYPLDEDEFFEYKCIDCQNYMSPFYSFPNIPGNIEKYTYINTENKDILCEYCFKNRSESNKSNFEKCKIDTSWISYYCDYCEKKLKPLEDVFNIICNKIQKDACQDCIGKIDILNKFACNEYVPVKIIKSFNSVDCFYIKDKFVETESDFESDSESDSYSGNEDHQDNYNYIPEYEEEDHQNNFDYNPESDSDSSDSNIIQSEQSDCESISKSESSSDIEINSDVDIIDI